MVGGWLVYCPERNLFSIDGNDTVVCVCPLALTCVRLSLSVFWLLLLCPHWLSVLLGDGTWLPQAVSREDLICDQSIAGSLEDLLISVGPFMF